MTNKQVIAAYLSALSLVLILYQIAGAQGYVPPLLINLRDEGTSQGAVNALDCVGSGIACTVSGAVGTVTISGGGGGSTITVNGAATASTSVDLDDATPAAPEGTNVFWQKDALTPTNISAYVKAATASIAGVVTTAAQTFAGDKTFNGEVFHGGATAYTADISPAQITSNQNDYNPANLATSTILRLNTDVRRDITGLQQGTDGVVKTIVNTGVNFLRLVNGSTASSVANRFLFGSDLWLGPAETATIIYDSTNTNWRLEAYGTRQGTRLGRGGVFLRNEFSTETSTTSGGDGFLLEVNSTGSSSNNSANILGNRPGWARATTGASATGRAALVTDQNILFFSGGPTYVETSLNVTTLSTSAERYQLLIGFADTNSAANQVDGAYILYDEGGVSTGSAASANWQCVTSNNSTRTFTTSGVAVTAATITTLRVEVNDAGTSVGFFADETSLCTAHTTNIPTTNARATGILGLIIKSVGTTARTVDYDYVEWRQDFLAAR